MSAHTLGAAESERAAQTNLPVQLTSFIGRQRELAEVRALLSGVRYVTLTGAGGCGKTRLAWQAATGALDEFPDGVWWVELAPLSDPELVPQAVASALGVRQVSDESLSETLARYVKGKCLLLVLDNCEHLRRACVEFAQGLLIASPNLKILATSRESLGAAGETLWLVPPLTLPEAAPGAPSQLLQYDGTALFVERAKAVLSSFAPTQENAASIVQICQRLDGIPLALELAAARVNVLTVQQIAARLDNAFALLTAGRHAASLARHQTLRAAMDWSHALLSDKERAMFRRLSVFAGGFTVEAAEFVCERDGIASGESLDLLSQLVAKSLVVADTQARAAARYRLLEPIRQYAHARLKESGESQSVRDQHLQFYLQLAEIAEPRLKSAEQLPWLDRLEFEHDNLRAAMAWSFESKSDAGFRLAGALFWFWYVRGYWREGRRWAEEGLARVQARPGLRAQALFVVGAMGFNTGDFAVARQVLEESLELCRTAGESGGQP